MTRRKLTTVYKRLIGEKHFVAKYEPGSFLMWIVIGVIVFAVVRGCAW